MASSRRMTWVPHAAMVLGPNRLRSGSAEAAAPETIAREPALRSVGSDGGARAAAREGAPDHQHDDRADDRSDESCAFTRPVPADSLTEIGCHECSDDSEDRGEYEAGRLIVARSDQLGDHARDEAYDDGPDDAHSCRTPPPPNGCSDLTGLNATQELYCSKILRPCEHG